MPSQCYDLKIVIPYTIHLRDLVVRSRHHRIDKVCCLVQPTHVLYSLLLNYYYDPYLVTIVFNNAGGNVDIRVEVTNTNVVDVESDKEKEEKQEKRSAVDQARLHQSKLVLSTTESPLVTKVSKLTL